MCNYNTNLVIAVTLGENCSLANFGSINSKLFTVSTNLLTKKEKRRGCNTCWIYCLPQWPTTVSSDPCVCVTGGCILMHALVCCQLAECRPWRHCRSIACTDMEMSKIPYITLSLCVAILCLSAWMSLFCPYFVFNFFYWLSKSLWKPLSLFPIVLIHFFFYLLRFHRQQFYLFIISFLSFGRKSSVHLVLLMQKAKNAFTKYEVMVAASRQKSMFYNTYRIPLRVILQLQNGWVHAESLAGSRCSHSCFGEISFGLIS